MLQVGRALVSLDVIERFFICNLDKCLGACCVEGDAGAPVTEEECRKLKEILGVVWDDLLPEARRVIEQQGVAYVDEEGDLVTSIAKEFGDDRFRIDLKHAEYTLGVEIRDEFALLYWDEYRAPGGLPVGSNPRVLTLLSGGIDSPVAAWMTATPKMAQAFTRSTVTSRPWRSVVCIENLLAPCSAAGPCPRSC